MGDAPVSESRSIWRRLLVIAPLGVVLGMLLVLIVARELVPPVLIYGLAFVVVAVLAWKLTGKAAPIIVLVASVLIIVGNLPFVIEDLSHPESAFGFADSSLILISALTGIVSAVAVLRRWQENKGRATWMVAAGLVVASVAVGVVAAANLEDDLAVTGDVRIEADRVEFVPEMPRAAAGQIAVFVDNKDPVRHTFTIEALDVDIEVPAATARRVEFTAQAGTYEFTCTVPGHESMKGTLTVAG